ncbi:discoidin domain-containing protein [Cellulomonas xylanilytica]|uniref:Glycosyl hydrolase n=1 Tax=Cellulomonas xylanilytica TaxID=233583 RepID=A0A510V4Z5_9CELL|nr:discoidin domain-containing protein [Cellulomonas xylanilytica]GEK21939.1 glycosyl hydrolase [Cellulomonas xylanilytica]
MRRNVRLAVAGAVTAALVAPLGLALVAQGAQAAEPNLAAGKPATASSTSDVYGAGNVTDGNQATYWESTNNQFPQWVQVDLGTAATVTDLTLKLPTGAWGARTQTITVQGSTNGSTFSTLKNQAGYTFDPGQANTVNVDVTDTSVRYVRLSITGNTGWPAGQISELEVHGSATPNPTPTTTTPPVTGQNLALSRPIAASSTEWSYAAGNAVDGNLGTYWEGAGGQYPSTLTVTLASASQLSAVTVRLNPDGAWGNRTQTFEVQGRTGTGAFTTLASSAGRAFSPSTGNTVTVAVSGTASDVRLVFTGNTGAGNGQVAELQVFGAAAPNPDLTVTGVTGPANATESTPVTLSATVKNVGTSASAATSVAFQVDGQNAATASVGAIAAGATATVTASIGARAAGSYTIGATADPANTVVEQNESNNAYSNPAKLVVSPVPSSDLVPVVSWSPSNPAAGAVVTFTGAIANNGNIATSTAAHGLTVTIKDSTTGSVVKTLTGSISGVVAAGATSGSVNLGTWTAGNGTFTVSSAVAPDSTEVPGKQANNVVTGGIFVGRGARLPFDMYEAEDGRTGGGAVLVGPNRTVGDLAGEASGRRAATLNATGSYVEWTTKNPTNTLVTRFSIPDNAAGTGASGSIDVFVNGTYLKRLDLTSRFAWLYGNETNPNNQPGSGGPRHIYDEASMLLGTTVPAGATIRLQRTASNPQPVTIDFINTELATADPNPNPAQYVQPTGFTHQDVQNALDRARMDTTGAIKGVYLPAGDYSTSNKFQVYGKAVDIVGAGPWFTRFFAPAGQENTDVGFRAEASSNGSKFRGFAYFGNYTSRIDGPGKVLDFTNVANMTVDNLWVEHMICMFWASNMDSSTITNSRIRNTFADGINMTNGSANNRVANIEARGTGDDSFALFAATDAGGTGQTGNVYENLTSLVTWRAAGLAVYGGYGNVFRNIYIADTLVYSGITISSLDFGYPMDEFGSAAPTSFQNISIVRAGGHFWGNQTFPAIWVFSASKKFQGIRVSDVDIVDPTYSGIMFQTNYTGPTSPQNPITDTTFTNVSITGARKSGDAWDAKSGFGIWANEMPEQGQGPAVGSVTFTNLRMSGNAQDIRNTTSTFTINRN